MKAKSQYFEILLLCLHYVFGFGDTVLTYFHSYLENKTQIVTIHGKHSTLLFVKVYHRDHFGTNTFSLYLQPLSNVIKHYPVLHQVYADDTQIYKSCTPSEIVDTIKKCIEQCISNVKT